MAVETVYIETADGSGAYVAVDLVGSNVVQFFKLDLGADGASSPAVGYLPVRLDAAIPAGTNNIGDVDIISSALPSGASTSANQSSGLTLTGAVTETAPASDTASSGLNGRLQRIAQRLTSLIALLPASLGQKASANSLAVVLASDQSVLPIRDTTSITVTPTISTGVYASGDAIGGLMTFASAASAAGTIYIDGVTIIDKDQERAAIDLVIFDRTFTATSDNAVFAPSDADLLNAQAVIPMDAYYNFSTNSIAYRGDLNIPVKLNGTSLYAQMVVRGTPTYTATSDLQVTIHLRRN